MDPDHTEEIRVSDEDSVEYFFASDASAIIEHTNRYNVEINFSAKYPSVVKSRWRYCQNDNFKKKLHGPQTLFASDASAIIEHTNRYNVEINFSA